MTNNQTINIDFNLEQLKNFNNTERKFRDYVTIHQLFEEQVEKNPTDVAVICDQGKLFNDKNYLTFEELNNFSNQLARHLRKSGVGPDKVVGICVDRSFAMIIGILGILKSGGAYLPLSPEYPSERIS